MKPVRKKQRHRQIEGKPLIEVRVKEPKQLFDARDPAPFRERDLDDDLAEYILSSAKEIPLSTPFIMRFYISHIGEPELDENTIRDGVHEHFRYQVTLRQRELQQFAKRAQLFFVIGSLVLTLCLTIAKQIPASNQTSLAIIREGLVIFGWVSMWKPIELILFDWYPLFEKLRIYRKITLAPIDVKFQTTQQEITDSKR